MPPLFPAGLSRTGAGLQIISRIAIVLDDPSIVTMSKKVYRSSDTKDMGTAASCKGTLCGDAEEDAISPKIKIGVDEAGRGPLFGPVYAAAVILPGGFDASTHKVYDSKRYHTARSLGNAEKTVRKVAIAVGVGTASPAEIDTLNIRKATHLAMHRAISEVIRKASLDCESVSLMIDGNDFTPYSRPTSDEIVVAEHKCIVKGDTKEPAISAASIIAKVARDNYIRNLCDAQPELDSLYGIRRNKGYGTTHHMEAIRKHGITKHHRTTFRPCRRGGAGEPVSDA